MISINFNPSVLKAQNSLNIATSALNKSLLRMSTGYKINSASDDAAGLFIASGLSNQISGLRQAQSNVSTGLSYLGIAEGALGNMTNILNRLRDLAVQGSNGTYDATARTAMQNEANALMQELGRIQDSTLFNGLNVFGNNSLNAGISNILALSPPTSRSASVASISSTVIPEGYTAIYTAEDLRNIENNLSGKYILMNDIDLEGIDWDPIGEVDSANGIFTGLNGTLDGNGYCIKNLSVNQSEQGAGLFAFTQNATIKNLGIKNVNITGNELVGGIIGIADSTIIENCYVVDGNINGASCVGGLVGNTAADMTITNCYTDIEIYGDTLTGGLVGDATNYRDDTCIFTMKNCYSLGNASGITRIGGLIGNNCFFNGGYVILENSYATGDVTGQNMIGGLVGNNYGDIKNCYSTGNVTGIEEVGGITGYTTDFVHANLISNSYATGKVTGNNYTGALVGYAENLAGYGVTIEDCFYNTDLNEGLPIVDEETGTITINNIHALQAKDISNKNKLNTLGWDTSIWSFDYGQPMLLNMPTFHGVVKNNVRLLVGANSASITNSISFDLGFNVKGINVNLMQEINCQSAIGTIDDYLDLVNKKMTEIGAVQNRLESVIDSQNTQLENCTSALSTIMDADIAEESANYVKAQILQQTTSSLLSQAQSIQASVILNMINSMK